jgi:hypothetical protein
MSMGKNKNKNDMIHIQLSREDCNNASNNLSSQEEGGDTIPLSFLDVNTKVNELTSESPIPTERKIPHSLRACTWNISSGFGARLEVDGQSVQSQAALETRWQTVGQLMQDGADIVMLQEVKGVKMVDESFVENQAEKWKVWCVHSFLATAKSGSAATRDDKKRYARKGVVCYLRIIPGKKTERGTGGDYFGAGMHSGYQVQINQRWVCERSSGS